MSDSATARFKAALDEMHDAARGLGGHRRYGEREQREVLQALVMLEGVHKRVDVKAWNGRDAASGFGRGGMDHSLPVGDR